MGAQQSMRWETGCVGEVGGGEVPKIGRKAGSARFTDFTTSPIFPAKKWESSLPKCESP